MSGSKRENAYVNFDHKKLHFCTFHTVYFAIDSIVPYSKSYESRSFIFTQFWVENVIEIGTC